MKCGINDCPGEYEQREVVHTVRQGNRIIVIDHVPAEVCTVCGEYYSHLRRYAESSTCGILLHHQPALYPSTISPKQNRHEPVPIRIFDTPQSAESCRNQDVQLFFAASNAHYQAEKPNHIADNHH